MKSGSKKIEGQTNQDQFKSAQSYSGVERSEPFNWIKVQEKLKEKASPQVFFWFSSLSFISNEETLITVEAKNDFDRDWIKTHYHDFILETIKEIYGDSFSLEIISRASSHITTDSRKGDNRNRNQRKNGMHSGSLNPKYSFENFIVGSSNRFAHAASFAAAERPGKTYNPIFIHGGVGLGKTHLINAIGNHALNNGVDNSRICCISAEDFTNQVINSIQTNKMETFRNKYRFGCDILMIDDIQFIAGKQSTQEEFFHTFNVLYESKKQVILTSDKSPNEMNGLEERLISRFKWGLIADIQPPQVETRIAIITKKAISDGVELPQEVAMFIAQQVSSNVRELEGSLNNIIAQSKLLNTGITIDIAKKVLKTLTKRQPPKIITIEMIQKEVADCFDIKIKDLKSANKQKNISTPRQIAMFLSRTYTADSFTEIGEKFGGKDHSTVVHACKKIEDLIEKDPVLTSSIKSISQKLQTLISG